MKYCTKFRMVQCRSGYNGKITMNITKIRDLSKTSILLSEHESATMVGRNDTQILLQKN